MHSAGFEETTAVPSSNNDFYLNKDISFNEKKTMLKDLFTKLSKRMLLLTDKMFKKQIHILSGILQKVEDSKHSNDPTSELISRTLSTPSRLEEISPAGSKVIEVNEKLIKQEKDVDKTISRLKICKVQSTRGRPRGLRLKVSGNKRKIVENNTNSMCELTVSDRVLKRRRQ